MSKLFVDEIQPKTTGGIINFNSNRPAFRVIKENQQITSSGQELITWDNIAINIGNHFANNIFTAPIAGIYSFSLVALTPNDSSNHVYTFKHTPNGGSATDILFMYNAIVANHETVSGSCIQQMGVGDTMGVYLQGVNDGIYGDVNSFWTNWSGFLVG